MRADFDDNGLPLTVSGRRGHTIGDVRAWLAERGVDPGSYRYCRMTDGSVTAAQRGWPVDQPEPDPKTGFSVDLTHGKGPP